MICDGKVTYDGYGSADKVCKRMKRRHRYGGAHPYRCPECRRWHISTQPDH